LMIIRNRDEIFLDQQTDGVELYFGLDVFRQFEARVPGKLTKCSVYGYSVPTVQSIYRGKKGVCVSNSGTPASNRMNIESPKYNDDVSLLISQYLISDLEDCLQTKAAYPIHF
jgi:hypothetical protein